MSYRAQDVLRPSNVKHDSRRRDVKADLQIALRFEAALLSVRLALEIQAKCGLIPLSEARQNALEGHREIAADRAEGRVTQDLPAHALQVLQASFDELLGQTACTHCEARSECPVLNAKLLQ